jgi:chaperonin GroEL (HSP60 family)
MVTYKSLDAPITRILSNAASEGVFEGTEYPNGYDVKEYVHTNMFEAGILDTAKGIKNALINSVSASNNLLRTNNVVTLKRFSQDGK